MTMTRIVILRLLLAAALVTAAGGYGCQRKKATPRPTTMMAGGGVLMMHLPGGEFVMGNANGEADEKSVRTVRVSPFYMDSTEVTQAEYQRLMGTNPAKFKGPSRPVEQLSWLAAIKYCNARSLSENLTPCYDLATGACDFAADGYRLPTEAEWEYACRAGGDGDYSHGNDAAGLKRHAWHKPNAAKATHAVRTRRANAWGLHDLHGNVAEWCHDPYAESYDLAATDNPTGPAAGKERVLRGGSFRSSADRCRSAARDSEPPGLTDVCFGYEAYGFRCVRRAKKDPGSGAKLPWP